MKILAFRTNIYTEQAAEMIGLELKKDKNINSTFIDTTHPDRIMIISGEVDSKDICERIHSAGYSADEIL